MCVNAVIAAMYLALTMINPLSYGAVQLRIADIIGAMPLFSVSTVPGILIGIALANLFSPLGFIDVAAGVIANGIGYAIIILTPLKKIPNELRGVILSAIIAIVISIEISVALSAPLLPTAAGLFISTLLTTEIGIFVMKRMPGIWGRLQ